MQNSVQVISLTHLAFAFIPALTVLAILYRWSVQGTTALYALMRMVVQLLLVGYFLVFIFEAKHAGIVIGVLSIMLCASSWIAMRPIARKRAAHYITALASIAFGGLLTLVLVMSLVLTQDRWFEPRYLVPLAGMIFANAMNTVSLAAERLEAEYANDIPHAEARRIALQAALIPMLNSLFAVGLVALPGMMTGQILAGVSPLVAIRYQIVVMCMTFGAAGIAAACYLTLLPHFSRWRPSGGASDRCQLSPFPGKR